MHAKCGYFCQFSGNNLLEFGITIHVIGFALACLDCYCGYSSLRKFRAFSQLELYFLCVASIPILA